MDKYRGLDGHQTGFGEISYKNGDLYEGGVQNGLRHREGRLFKASNCTWYEGSWIHGTLFGHVIISSSNWIFEGQLPDANEVSNGKLSYPDGSFYEGQILNFKRSGKGTLTDPAGGKTTVFGKISSMSLTLSGQIQKASFGKAHSRTNSLTGSCVFRCPMDRAMMVFGSKVKWSGF